MIKTIAYKISSIALALLVLFSTLSFTVEKHFCNDNLVDTAVFTAIGSCCGGTLEKGLETPEKKSCCENTVDLVEGQNELHINSFDDLELEQQIFLKAFALSYINNIESLPQLVIPHKDYSPPNIIQDIQVLDEVYLI